MNIRNNFEEPLENIFSEQIDNFFAEADELFFISEEDNNQLNVIAAENIIPNECPFNKLSDNNDRTNNNYNNIDIISSSPELLVPSTGKMLASDKAGQEDKGLSDCLEASKMRIDKINELSSIDANGRLTHQQRDELRKLKNAESACRSRQTKKNHKSTLEDKVYQLKAEIKELKTEACKIESENKVIKDEINFYEGLRDQMQSASFQPSISSKPTSPLAATSPAVRNPTKKRTRKEAFGDEIMPESKYKKTSSFPSSPRFFSWHNGLNNNDDLAKADQLDPIFYQKNNQNK